MTNCDFQYNIYVALPGIMSSFALVEGEGGLQKVVISTNTSRAEVYLFGATVTSWIVDGKERLFLSSKAIFNGVKAIRGGIPVVFPQFSQPLKEMNQHGFARTSLFKVESHSVLPDKSSIEVVFSLSDSDSTRAVWPYEFKLNYTVTLTNSTLTSNIDILNSGSVDFKCHTLLHSYLAVPSIHRTAVSGFKSCTYIDKLTNETTTEERDVATIDREVDRVMLGASLPLNSILVSDYSNNENIIEVNTKASNDGILFPFDVVFWNPWIEKAKALADLGDEDYLVYVCVEPGLVADWVSVSPNSHLILEQTLRVT